MTRQTTACTHHDEVVETFAAEIATAAYAMTLRLDDATWLERQLDLWRTVKAAAAKWRLEPEPSGACNAQVHRQD